MQYKGANFLDVKKDDNNLKAFHIDFLLVRLCWRHCEIAIMLVLFLWLLLHFENAKLILLKTLDVDVACSVRVNVHALKINVFFHLLRIVYVRPFVCLLAC